MPHVVLSCHKVCMLACSTINAWLWGRKQSKTTDAITLFATTAVSIDIFIIASYTGIAGNATVGTLRHEETCADNELHLCTHPQRCPLTTPKTHTAPDICTVYRTATLSDGQSHNTQAYGGNLGCTNVAFNRVM